MSVVIARKSGYLETESQHRYGEVENSNEVTDFKVISSRNRRSIAYFGFNNETNVSRMFWLNVRDYKSEPIANHSNSDF